MLITRKAYLLLCSLFLFLAISICGEEPSSSPKQPNIVLVMADDQGWGDVGYQGHPYVQTPTLDSMASSGFVFERFYAAAPVCSPTRASVLTGRHPFRSKTLHHGHYMRPHEFTLAEALRDAGYTTGIFGKLHLGSGQPDSPCNPSGMGFDEWVIGLNYFDIDPYLSRNGQVERANGKGSVVTVTEAIRFLERHQSDDHPFFAAVWFPSPHGPHQETPEGPVLYQDQGRKRAGFYREITLLDQQVGRLRNKLNELNLADNTILWYCSDNGSLFENYSGGRERKSSIYEGGLRVPAIIEWPAAKLKGKTSVPVTTSDIFPTLMSMAGIDFDPPHALDGIDASGIIAGKNSSRNQPIGFWHDIQEGQHTKSDEILSELMEKQKSGAPTPHLPERIQKDVSDFPQFSENLATGHAAWTDYPWKLHRIDGDTFELYHLEDDPMESTDLANQPEHLPRIQQMKADLSTWMQSVVRSLNGKDYAKRNGARLNRSVSPIWGR